MVTPLELMHRYRALRVQAGVEYTASQCRPMYQQVELRKYFMMNWTPGSAQKSDFDVMTSRMSSGTTAQSRATAQTTNQWYARNKEGILNAAMGKGRPQDYELALEWAIRSGKIADPTQKAIQHFCDEHLGIDCSGFATNYLVANGYRAYSASILRGSSAQSYYKVAHSIDDPADVQQGDLLVWMSGNAPKGNPGHIAVVQQYLPLSREQGNMHVVEATGAGDRAPVDSWYHVLEIIPPKAGANQVMIFRVKRFNSTNNRVCVIRYGG